MNKFIGVGIGVLLSMAFSFSSAPARADEPPKSWSMFVYGNYDNQNRPVVGGLLSSIDQIPYDPSINVVAQVDQGKASRHVLTANGTEKVANLGNVDSADPATLREFLDWAKTTYPAQRYLVLVVGPNDGRGLIPDKTSGNPGMPYIGFADTLRAFGHTLPQGRVDILSLVLPSYGYFSGYSADLPILEELIGAAHILVGNTDNIGTDPTEGVVAQIGYQLKKYSLEDNRTLGERLALYLFSGFVAVDLTRLKPFMSAVNAFFSTTVSKAKQNEALANCIRTELKDNYFPAFLTEAIADIRTCAVCLNHPDLFAGTEDLYEKLGARPEVTTNFVRYRPSRIEYVTGEDQPTQTAYFSSSEGQAYACSIPENVRAYRIESNYGTEAQPDWRAEANVQSDYGYYHLAWNFPRTSPMVASFQYEDEAGKRDFIFNLRSEWYPEIEQMAISRDVPAIFELRKL